MKYSRAILFTILTCQTANAQLDDYRNIKYVDRVSGCIRVKPTDHYDTALFISSYIPDQYTPVVTIPVSIHVWRKDDGTGNWWQDTPAFRDSLQVAFDYLNFIYAHNVPYSLYIPNTQFVEDTKVRFLIDTVYYHNDSHLAFENNIDSFQYYLADNHPECLKYFNYHLSIDSTANFSGHSS